MNHEDSFLIQKPPSEEINLPPGFRFHPTDEELITHYLLNKVLNSNFNAIAITEVDLNKCEPWDLPKKSKLGEKESYFYSLRGRKYPTGLRTNRATEAGYWKATGKDKEIRREKITIGMKKTLVFYRGRAPKGQKTDWIMHEYRLEGNYAMNEWVICKVVKKRSQESGKKASGLAKIASWSPSFGEEIVQGAPPSPIMDAHVSCFSNSFFHDVDLKSSLEASSSFYGGEFMASAAKILEEMGISIAVNTEISSENEVERYSLEDYQWNY